MKTLLAQLPLGDAENGPLFDRQNSHDALDARFADWEAPLVWHHQESYLRVDGYYNKEQAVHFAFEAREPAKVWSKMWQIWYDNALLWRGKPPMDCLLEATIALEEQTAGFGGDNVDHVRPWCGLVARMQDLRRYYFLTLEFPDAVVLYRRDDKQWVPVARHQVELEVWRSYALKLECRGNQFRVWLDDRFLFRAMDYAYENGWAGIRATCTSFVTDFRIHALETAAPAKRLPPPAAPKPGIVSEFDLSDYGMLSVKGKKAPANLTDARYNAEVKIGDYLGNGRQVLIVRVHGQETTHVCVDTRGRLIWAASLPGVEHWVNLPAQSRAGMDLAGVGKEELYVVEGCTGRVIQRTPTPRTAKGKSIGAGNCPNATADFDGNGVKDCFFLSVGADDREIWAYDSSLRLRWHAIAPSGGGHGNHISVCDVDGDGRDEIFHGCALWNHQGEMLWPLDEVVRRLKCPNGGHVDASVMGFFGGTEGIPTLHMASSSAGHIVAEARTGELLAVHPQGHVQTVTTGKIVPGRSDTQIISTNRWGSYGVTGVYSPMGQRLSRFTPGFVCQGTKPIAWREGDVQDLLVVDGQGWRGIYDHQGQRLVDLDPWVPYEDAHRQRYDRVQAWILKPDGGSREGILLRLGNRLRLLAT